MSGKTHNFEHRGSEYYEDDYEENPDTYSDSSQKILKNVNSDDCTYSPVNNQVNFPSDIEIQLRQLSCNSEISKESDRSSRVDFLPDPAFLSSPMTWICDEIGNRNQLQNYNHQLENRHANTDDYPAYYSDISTLSTPSSSPLTKTAQCDSAISLNNQSSAGFAHIARPNIAIPNLQPEAFSYHDNMIDPSVPVPFPITYAKNDIDRGVNPLTVGFADDNPTTASLWMQQNQYSRFDSHSPAMIETTGKYYF